MTESSQTIVEHAHVCCLSTPQVDKETGGPTRAEEEGRGRGKGCVFIHCASIDKPLAQTSAPLACESMSTLFNRQTRRNPLSQYR